MSYYFGRSSSLNNNDNAHNLKLHENDVNTNNWNNKNNQLSVRSLKNFLTIKTFSMKVFIVFTFVITKNDSILKKYCHSEFTSKSSLYVCLGYKEDSFLQRDDTSLSFLRRQESAIWVQIYFYNYVKPIFMTNQLLIDLFQAYYSCRKNKRNTLQALEFEMNYETHIIELYHDIIEKKYEIQPSIAFIVKKPVMREVFAGNFRDRVVHHYIISELNQYFEKVFIYDSYSCRVWKGTLFWINQAKKYMRACSTNFTQETYVLKLDIQSFFMWID